MHNKSYKKAIVFALCLTMLMPLGSMVVSSTDESSSAADTNEAVTTADESGDKAVDDSSDADAEDADADSEDKKDTASKKDDEVQPITDEEALAMCEKIAEKGDLQLYLDEENERLCLYVKSTGKYWWSSPINVEADQTIIDSTKGSSMKNAQRKQIASSVAIRVGDLRQEKRTESPAPVYSNKARVKWQTETDGVVATYAYSTEGVTLKVHYVLEEDNLYIYCDSDEIEEKNTSQVDGKVLTKLELTPNFGAADSEAEGYMIVPDGSGAVINYNNGKTDYADYAQQVFGRDYTAVPITAPRTTQQAYMPVLATVSGSEGLVCVASDGESNVYAHAQVSGQEKQAYNSCYFEFETRSSDSFFMNGDNSNKITVFEKNGIKTERFGVRYYPVSGDNGEDLNYADCAAVYRDYLINQKGLTAKAEANKNDLYVDLFGGVMKDTSILGIPFNLKTEITGFDQASEILDTLKENGVDTVTVNYNDWTNDSIKNKISTEVSPSGTLGGSKDFDALLSKDENIKVVPSMNNFQMDSGSWGYMTLTSTAIRVSNAYSRQSSYSPAFGVAEKGVSPALLTPNKYSNVFSEMLESYTSENVSAIGFGDYSTRLVSDYSKKDPSSRSKTMNTIVDGYKEASEKIGTVLADGANSYVLPYVTNVSNVPVSSSGFNVTDYDIPFYQMVIHGYINYSSTPINKNSNSDETFLLSLASGSQIHYDLTYADSDTLQDTDYDDLYYSNYAGWTGLAANQYKAAQNILSAVSDYTITKYELSDDKNVLTTTYSKDGASDVVISVDKAKGTATVGTEVYDLADCIEGGLAE
ncbi:DUF5696 domain-containing protein [Ruminococcus sp.]|uniref:DUF5696 domain-containing protein n=1 Tax=Ruminococcus sp. TaxID=41978 RepID=UPI0025FFD25F|nr:DUF5696 domain-containing protein [Ruminococcus sp.]